MKRFLTALLLAGAMLVARSAAVGAGQARPEPVVGVSHVVKPGETLWSIAKRSYRGEDPREGVDRIMRANRLDKGLLRAGMKIVVPSR